MASPMVSRAPQCLSCIRRVSGLEDSLRSLSGQQIRGKKKLAKATTINVKLRANIAGFGRKGSIVPVPPGTMRNTWFPRKMAEYQTLAQLKGLGDVVIERDSTFSPRESKRLGQEKREVQDARKVESIMVPEALELQETFAAPIEEAVPEAEFIEPEMLSVRSSPHLGWRNVLTFVQSEQAAIIIAKLVPENLEFYRTPMPAPPPPKKLSPSLASSSAISAAAAKAAIENAKRDPQQLARPAIYGSVSIADVVANIKAILWEDIEGSRVILSTENVSFVEQSSLKDKDRVKHLGSFTIDIRLGPAESEKVRRTITVRAQQ
ncbi:hypothetical protein D0Z07_3901 [Hyphodiscus hymeniophilus]|uniref:Ribosomal protein L9 domain-containing protein n=1 Tax=Hyphodiscus hymeniophilus TaxID=353542 RepID=A0A9P7AY11_9HELO|nr:hypothetical protein D0Z07_3901 [Hyphodiscus hymeniophilus]